MHSLAAPAERQDPGELVQPIFGEQQRDGTARDLLRGVPVEALGAAIPRQNPSVEIFADDGVVRRVDDGREDAPGFQVRIEMAAIVHRYGLPDDREMGRTVPRIMGADWTV